LVLKHHHKKLFGKIFYHTRKWTWFTTLAAVIFLFVVGGIAQYWLPKLIADKAQVEHYLSKASKQTITIGRLQTAWDGVYPGIRATDIVIRDPKTPAHELNLKEVRASLSYLSILRGKPTLHRLIIIKPELEIVRNADGRLRVSGIQAVNKPAKISKPDRQESPAAVEWLLSQGRVEIKDGHFLWRDRVHRGVGVLDLKNVDLALVNSGERHQLDFSAKFPEDICKVCNFSLDIEGNPLISKKWGGFVNFNAIGLNLRNRLTLLYKKFPANLVGEVDLVLRSQWSQGVPRIAYGRITANDLTVPLGKFGNSLTLDNLVSSIRWRGRENNWKLEADLPFVRINDQPWLPGQIKITRYTGGTSVYLRHLNIKQAVKLTDPFRIPPKVRQLISRLQPSGFVDNLYVDLKDKKGEEDRLKVKAEIRQLASLPYKKIPGIKGLNANVDTSETHGEIFVNSQRGEFNSTHVFRQPLPINRAKARIVWQLKNNIVDVNTQNIQLIGRDLSVRGGFVFHLPLDRRQSPQLDLRAEIFNGVVARKSIYLPVNVLKPRLVSWLDQSIVSGKLTDGHVIYRGKTREFPFVNNNGLFEVEANVEHGKLNFLPGWKPLFGANMKLLFRGHSMLITGSSARVDRLDVNELVARKDNFKDHDEPIRVTGRISGPVNDALAVLRDAAAHGQKGGWTRFVQSDIQAFGKGQLSLRVEIPAIHGRPHHMQGRYEFLNSGLVLPVGDIPAKNIVGVVRFNEKGVVDGNLQANALGGPVNVAISGQKRPRDPETTFRLNGRMTVRGLADEYGEWIGRYFSGNMPWAGTVSFTKGIPNIALQGKMKAIKTSLPQPVRQLSNIDESLVLKSTSNSHKRQILRLELGNQFSGMIDYQAFGDRWKFVEGRLLVGPGMASLKGENGLYMDFRSDRLKAEDWVQVVHDASGGEGVPTLVQGVSGQFENVDSLDRDWGKAQFVVKRNSRNTWSGDIEGNSLKGKVVLDTGHRGGKIALDLDRLHIPEGKKEEDKKKAEKNPWDPRQFPTLEISSRDFSFGVMQLGQLDFSAQHTRIGWEINRFDLKRPDMIMSANGTWFRVAGNYVTDVRMGLTSTDLGNTMAALGNPGQVTGGTMNMDVNLNWRQDSKNRGFENLNGDISLEAKDGKFNKIDPAQESGGPFSLFSLSRYLSLDFSPAFGKGLAFNSIKGKIAVQQGVARSDGLTMTASVASVIARGYIGLAKRDIDVNADIYPNLKGGVTIATGSIFGLQAAAWAYAIQQLFSHEIEKGTRISYHITGSLDKPKVTKMIENSNQAKK